MRSLLLLASFLIACDATPSKPRGSTPTTPAPAVEAPAGAAEAPAAPNRREGEIAGLHYLELTTEEAGLDETLPIVVAIHGLGDDPEGFSSLLRGLRRPVRVILPRGVDEHEPGYSWFPLRARDPDVLALSDGIRSSADLIAKALEELRRTLPGEGPYILTGFSQGGMLSFALAIHHPELFSYAFPVGGWVPPPLMPKEPVLDMPTTLAFHGMDDPAVKYAPTKQATDELLRQGNPVQLVSYPKVRHAIPPQMRMELHNALRRAIDEHPDAKK